MPIASVGSICVTVVLWCTHVYVEWPLLRETKVIEWLFIAAPNSLLFLVGIPSAMNMLIGTTVYFCLVFAYFARKTFLFFERVEAYWRQHRGKVGTNRGPNVTDLISILKTGACLGSISEFNSITWSIYLEVTAFVSVAAAVVFAFFFYYEVPASARVLVTAVLSIYSLAVVIVLLCCAITFANLKRSLSLISQLDMPTELRVKATIRFTSFETRLNSLLFS